MGLNEISPQISFNSLFDEYSPSISKELFKDEVVARMQSSGKTMEINRDGDGHCDIIAKTLDPHESRMYNVFKSNDEYKQWLQQSMHEPTEDEIMAAMRENGTGT